jgi:alpha-L-rhamnosidase
MRPVRLRCEQREDVPCLDSRAPRLSWALESGEQGARQTAYRVLVGEGGALWDSGKVASDRSIDIVYAGRELPPAGEFGLDRRGLGRDG